MPDYGHLCLSIPPKYSSGVANTIGFLKGKSAIGLHRELLGRERNFTGGIFRPVGTASGRLGWMSKSSGHISATKKTRRSAGTDTAQGSIDPFIYH
jgi:hypothetical protein